MNMRGQMVSTVDALLRQDPNLVLLLGDIGVHGFRDAIKSHPSRVYNIGILEGATVSVAAGLAKLDIIPIVHTIAPFLVERAYEQLKIDFGYQRLGGNFISVGASYDYASLGCTHHCPGDIGALMNIPGMELIVPGTALEFDQLFRQIYNNGKPTYFRLSERQNTSSCVVEFGKAVPVKVGDKATVIAVGPMLEPVILATADLDVAVLYYTTLYPFDGITLWHHMRKSSKVVLVEPFYEGTMAHALMSATGGSPISLECIGVPRAFIDRYGVAAEHDQALGLTSEYIRTRIRRMIDE